MFPVIVQLLRRRQAASLPSGSPDFLSALSAYWASSAALSTLFPRPTFGQAPAKTPPPYCTIEQVGMGKAGGRSAGSKGYWMTYLYKVSIYSSDLDDAVTKGEAARTELERLWDTPLKFANGYQMGFHLTGDEQLKLPWYANNNEFVYIQAYYFSATIGRARQ